MGKGWEMMNVNEDGTPTGETYPRRERPHNQKRPLEAIPKNLL